MSEYTKGEWEINKHDLNRWAIFEKGSLLSRIIAEVNTGESYFTDITPEEGKANASLIAQSPKLLKACEMLANCGVVEDGRVVERIMPSSSDILYAHELLGE